MEDEYKYNMFLAQAVADGKMVIHLIGKDMEGKEVKTRMIITNDFQLENTSNYILAYLERGKTKDKIKEF